MNGIDVLNALHLPEESHAGIVRGWGDSFINMPDPIEFLQEHYIREICAYLDVEQTTCGFLLETAAKILASKPLTTFTWHMYYRLLTPSFSFGCHPGGFGDWGPLTEVLGKHADAQILLCTFAAVGEAKKRYEALGYPPSLIRDTLSVFKPCCDPHIDPGKLPGGKLPSFSWMRLYLTCRLFQLGRFNYKLMETNPFGIVLRHRKNGNKIMLMEAGTKCNADGFMLQKDDPLEQGGWTNSLEEKDSSFCGNPVNPAGFALRNIYEFSKREWEVLLRPGDIMIDMHIPTGGKMTPEACLDSFRKAFAFFKQQQPGTFKPVIISHSWIFNTQFEQMLPESNLASLMRECFLFPNKSTGRDGMYFLFGRDYDDLSQAPHNTSVRRAMLSVLEQGKRLRNGGMLFFEEDLEAFGSAPYRNSFSLP